MAILIGVAGDSGSGKTTFSAALAHKIGPSRVTSICLDDYHRYDRAERARLGITALSPDCNRLDLMARHLHALRAGQPIVKPVYNHAKGTFDPDEQLVPNEFVIARGLLALHTEDLRAAFGLTVFLDPEPALRVQWKIARDTAKRGYTVEQVMKEIERRESDVERYILPQRGYADVVVICGAISHGLEPGDADSHRGMRSEQVG
ncbi:MAG TPA: phosphoribulokinase [Gemmatimonadaceae bacterium]|nr:phosphoribulokinase [Gemmatimonadaceae bacterium]